jgi:hypothetical protein
MLEHVRLKNVGPSPEMEMKLAPRLNLITGDNGLGKSFLLDVAWWALTRTWARQLVLPHAPPAPAQITYGYTKTKPGTHEYSSKFDRKAGSWSVNQGRPAIPGLVLYAQVDGGFSVWDPARNYWKKDSPDRPQSYLFSPEAVWNGNDRCEGLIRDWASWQREDGSAFEELKKVLKPLSPSPNELLEPGELRKLSVDDPKRYPTLRMPYGEDVAVVHASAGMRRVIALAYLLVWAWQEHLEASKLLGSPPAREIIFLIDETEAHLHPKWQRRIVPALLDVMDALTGKHGSHVQLITATHSPLVLASAEPRFDVAKDAWFDLDLEGKPPHAEVHLTRRDFVRRGDVSNWLTSEAFDLAEPRSLESEEAIQEALKLAKADSPSRADISRVEKLLKASLGDIDRFWVRWTEFRRHHLDSAKRESAK